MEVRVGDHSCACTVRMDSRVKVHTEQLPVLFAQHGASFATSFSVTAEHLLHRELWRQNATLQRHDIIRLSGPRLLFGCSPDCVAVTQLPK